MPQFGHTCQPSPYWAASNHTTSRYRFSNELILIFLFLSGGLAMWHLLRSRPTCHGIRRTVIDTARESLVFHFFCIILRLDPCRTGPLPPHWPSPTSSCLIGLKLEPPSRVLPHGQLRSFDISTPLPLDVTMTYDSDPNSNPYPFHDIIAYRSPTIRPLPLTLTIRTAIRYWLIPLHDEHFPLSLTYCTMLWLTLAYAAD